MHPAPESGLVPRIVTLGTAGGPRWWGPDPAGRRRNGIATAVVVGPVVYLVDCGRGASTQFAEAGLSMDRLRGVFLTHLHSDHTVGLPDLLLFGWMSSAASACTMDRWSSVHWQRTPSFGPPPRYAT